MENRPQVRFQLQKARKSAITPKDIATLVCQSLLPFDNPNYPALDPSAQWFQLQHQRDIPSVVVISVPGLPEEVVLDPNNEYHQPARLVVTAPARDAQNKDEAEGAAAHDQDQNQTKKDDARVADGESKNQNERQTETSANTTSTDESHCDAPTALPNVFPEGVNPWLRHIRTSLTKNNPTMNFGRLWLHHQANNSNNGSSMFVDDPNVAMEFFFRMKGGSSGSNFSNRGRPPNPAQHKQEQPSNNPTKLGDVVSFLKNRAAANSKIKNDDEASAASIDQGHHDENEEETAETKEEIPKELLELWDPSRAAGISKGDDAAAGGGGLTANNAPNSKKHQKISCEPTTLPEIALDIEGLRALGFPFETEATYCHPEPRDVEIVSSPSAATNCANRKSHENAAGFINFENQAASNDQQSSDDSEGANDAGGDDDQQARNGEAGDDEEFAIAMSQDSKVEPLPPYERLFDSDKQTNVLKYLRRKLMSISKAAKQQGETGDAAAGVAGVDGVGDLERVDLGGGDDDAVLKSKLDILASQLFHDITLTKNRKDRIQVTTPGLLSSSSSSVDRVLYSALALDCEMILTSGWGSTLSRLTFIDCPSGDVVVDVLIAPTNRVFDYVSRYSGIGATDLADIQLSFESARLLCQCLVSRDKTFVVGHSLENDFIVCRLLAEVGTVVDTAHLFPNPRGLPYRNSLKYLAFAYLNGRSVQNSGSGHDSAEDARTAMDLITLKLANGKDFGMPNRVNIMTWLCPAAAASTVPHHDAINCHLLEKPFIMKRICTGGADSIATSNDGTVSHRAEKLLKKYSKDILLSADKKQQQQQQQQVEVPKKSFIWAQLYDAPLRQEEEEELEKLLAADEVQEGAVEADAATPTGSALGDRNDAAKSFKDGPKTAKSFLKNHVTALHRRIHRIVNAAPDKTLFVVMSFAYPNTVSEQSRHPSHHGTVFSWIKNSKLDPELPEGDDMFDTPVKSADSGEANDRAPEQSEHMKMAASWGGM